MRLHSIIMSSSNIHYTIKHSQSYADILEEVYSYLHERQALFFLNGLKIIHCCYQIQIGCLIAKDQDDKIGGVLLYYVSGNALSGKGIYCSYDGFSVDNSHVAKLLFDEIHSIAHQVKAMRLSICSGSEHYDGLSDVSIKSKLGIDLTISKEQLWKVLRDKTRNAIRKAEKMGVQLEQGMHLLPQFYKIYSQRMQAKNIGVHSYSFFVELLNQYDQNCVVYSAQYNGIAIAAALIVYDNSIAHYLFSGMLSGYENACPIQYILWNAIETCYFKNIHYFDMGESTVDSGTYKFKIWFGCQPKEVYYYSVPVLPSIKRRLVLHSIMSKLQNFIYKLAYKIPVSHLKNSLLIKQRVHGKII